ncbi:MAG: ACP S-malonyltransferase [Myxococcota bacterium]|nr:ACP S-malonyltransferase [Myxococcota bacterium]
MWTRGIAWLFPGQGSQSVGMGKDVVASSAAARRVLERADVALGEPLSKTILEGPEEALTLTANAQPAIVATSCAILAALRELVPELPPPLLAAGHSLGEYSALVAAGALGLEDAIRVVRARGRAMQKAVPPGTGAMSAVMGVEPRRLAALCAEAAGGEVVAPANYNAPGQIVVAGHAGAVARLGALVASDKGRVIPLKVSAPFHCALMAPAARALEAELASISIGPPSFPIVANFDAQPNGAAGRVKDLLVRQVDGAVRWEDTIRFMVGQGVTHALEIGPGKVLAGLVKRIAKDMNVLSVGDTASLGEVTRFLAA